MAATAFTVIHGLGRVGKILLAAAAPTTENDSSVGISPGDIWIDTETPAMLVCMNAEVGASLWREIVVGLDDIATMKAVNGTVSGSATRALELADRFGQVIGYIPIQPTFTPDLG